MMRVSEIRHVAETLMRQHLDQSWKVIILPVCKMRKPSVLGVCVFPCKTIVLSARLVDLPNQIETTILHEIAHALVGYEAHHGSVWQTKAREIGVAYWDECLRGT